LGHPDPGSLVGFLPDFELDEGVWGLDGFWRWGRCSIGAKGFAFSGFLQDSEAVPCEPSSVSSAYVAVGKRDPAARRAVAFRGLADVMVGDALRELVLFCGLEEGRWGGFAAAVGVDAFLAPAASSWPPG
jgi:hypothetical protein